MAGDDEQALAREFRLRRGGEGRIRFDHHRGREGRAHADLAGHFHEPVHRLGEAADDREPEAGAAEATRRGGVGLGERFEDALQPVGGDADARVADRQQGAEAAVTFLEVEFGVHVAALGELDRVADEVGDDAAELDRVAQDRLRRVGAHQRGQLDAFAAGLVLELGDDLLERAHRVEGDALDRDVATVEAGEVEHVADRILELAGAGLDLAEDFGRRRHGGFEVRLAEPLDGVDRVADLVGDVGHELPLRRGDLLGLLQRDAQAVMFVDRLRDVEREREQPVRQAAAALDPFVHHADEPGAAVLGLEVHHRVQDALARADDFFVELTELLGRLRGEDVGEREVRPEAAVGQGEEFVEAAARVQDAPLQVAEDDEVRGVLDQRAGEAHARARGEDRGAVDLRVFGEDQPDLAVELRVGLEDDLGGPDRFAEVVVAQLEHAAPGGPARRGAQQGRDRLPVLEFQEEPVDGGPDLDLATDGALDQRVGEQHLALAAADHERPGQHFGQCGEVRHRVQTRLGDSGAGDNLPSDRGKALTNRGRVRGRGRGGFCSGLVDTRRSGDDGRPRGRRGRVLLLVLRKGLEPLRFRGTGT